MVVFETNFPDLRLLNRGKVRDLYEVDGQLLMVATDRISAYDVVMPTPIPDKGKVLTRLSLFWFEYLKDIVPNHLITADVGAYPTPCKAYRETLEGRSMLVVKAQPLPVECIVRGYISGSAWASYQKERRVCGLELPAGLRESDRLPEPIFTPSTKAAQGEHDVNISFSEMVDLIGQDLAQKVADISLALYQKAAIYAEERGIIIADTKFEFGLKDGHLILIDEVLTPDSSRFWPKEDYQPGRPQKSFDKQFLRDWLVSIGWDKRPPAPELPEDIVKKTRNRYIEALKRLTGEDFGENKM
ncbi:phosphoribosylaminoimidazolesuccinocarboxamide synthase [Thermosulfuriphilus sp.]